VGKKRGMGGWVWPQGHLRSYRRLRWGGSENGQMGVVQGVLREGSRCMAGISTTLRN